jgi:hypothetical protein
MVTILVIVVRRKPYVLVYAPVVKQHLRAVEPHHYSSIRATLQEQLRFEPGTETTNRKPLQQPALFDAQWELRFGRDNRFRAFFEIDHESRKVYILALGVKERNRLLIGGEEVKL